jgi:K+-transporting ATPase KdpF subunit
MPATIRQKELPDEGPGLCHYHGGILILLLVPGKIPGGGFKIMEIITAIAALALIVYLFVSIFKPEKF